MIYMATNPMKDKTLILKISETQDLSLDDLLTRAKGEWKIAPDYSEDVQRVLIVSTGEDSGKIIATAKLWTDDYRRSYTVKYYRTLTQTPDGETVRTTRKITFDTMTLTEDAEQLVGKSIHPLGGRATAFCKPSEEVQKYLH